MLKTFQAEGVNDAVRLSFFPMGGFLSPDDNKTVMCFPFGEDVQCRSDKWEACLLQVNCGGVACDSATQLRLVNFISCFEGPKVAFDSAGACATGAGFDAAAIQSCYDDEGQREAAFQMVQDSVQAADNPPIGMSAAFPWVNIGSVHHDVPDPADEYPLLETICAAVEAEAVEVPACRTWPAASV